jgi:DNA excision repair protein ERCC-2
MKLIKLALREFAVPTPRQGSIEMNSGYGRAMVEGIELHQQVQRKRELEHDDYEAEVKFSHTFERGGYQFLVEGRMDGIFDSGGTSPKIEEIKSTFEVHELLKKLRNAETSHPYCLQLLSYGYIYYLQNEVMPELSFHLISTRSRSTEDLEMNLDLKEYEGWLDRRLDELVVEAIAAEKRSERRRKIAKKFPFPFEKPRSGQVELIETIEKGMLENQRMLVQAPTGLGKTVGVLYPALKDALARGQRVLYVTPKNSQHSVAEDAVERFQDTGSPVKSLTINAKSKMCMKAEPLCNPRYCEYAKDYYEKVAQNDLIQELAKKKKLSSRVFKKFAEDFEVCPFELQLDASSEADVIICDYNYVFAPRSVLGRMPQISFAQEGKPNLVIDEAHNLPSRAMDYYSPSLSTMTLEKMREEMSALPKRVVKEAEALLEAAIRIVREACPPEAKQMGSRGVKFEPDVDPFNELDGEIRSFLSRYLEADYEIEPGDPVLRLTFYWSQFTEGLDEIVGGAHPEFFITYQAASYGREGGTIKVTCCDASEMLKPCYEDYDQVVAFSATLKPFEYYAQLSGLSGERLKIAEFLSPFDHANRKVMIIPQISTKYSERERNYPRISETISRVVATKPGNYLAFFPSFDFLERTLALFALPPGFRVVKQERYMKAAEIEGILNDLKAQLQPTIVFAVQGGVFSEGVDYPGEMVIGAFVVGPPLPNFDVERETMRKYYQDHYQEGFEYAYTYPAMAKAVQAAGRVIRSETDQGVIILMDSRFLENSYSKSMPTDWFEQSPRELVSQSILKDLQEFWK